MKKILFFLLLSSFAFAQTKVCNLSEPEVLQLAKQVTGTDHLETKKTALGYTVKSEDLKLVFALVGSNYSLKNIKGNPEQIKKIWKTTFNPLYDENSTKYENTILKKAGTDVRLQKYEKQFYIDVNSCQ